MAEIAQEKGVEPAAIEILCGRPVAGNSLFYFHRKFRVRRRPFIDRVELRALRRQRDDGYVWRDNQLMRQVTSRLVDEKHGVSAWLAGWNGPRDDRGAG